MAHNLRTIALRTSLVYAVLSGLWILLSDRLISLVASDSSALSQMQTYKGLFFVSVTTALLYVLLRAQLSAWRREIVQRQEAQQALAASHNYLKVILDSTNDAILVIDASSGQILDANQRLSEIFGYTREEALHKPVNQLNNVLMPHPTQSLSEFAAKSKSEGPQIFELQVKQKDGRLFWVELNLRFIRIADQARYIVSAHNIDQRKESEINLKESQRRLSTLVGNLPGMVYRCQNDLNWTMEYTSEGVFALTGYRPEDLVGNHNNSFGKLIHPADRQRVWNEIQLALKLQRHYKFIYRLVDISSIEKWVWEHGRGIFDENDQLLFLEGFITDISDQKQGEEKMREMNARLNVLINATPDIICFKDGQNRWLEANAADLALFKLTEVDYRGKTDSELAEFTDPIYRDAFLKCEESDERAWQKGETSRNEESIPSDGVYKTYDVIKAPIFDEAGNRKGLIVFGRDITDRKRFEEALYKRLSEMEALRTIDRAITSSFDLKVTLEILLKQALHKLEVDAAAILLFDPEIQVLKYIAAQGFRTKTLEKAEIRPGQGLIAKIMLEHKTAQTTNLATLENEKAFAKEEGFSAYYGVPLIAKGQIKGILEVFHRKALPEDPDWESFLETLANQTAIAIDNAQLFASLQNKNLELGRAYDATISGWARALELHEQESPGHSERIGPLTLSLAQSFNLSTQELIHIKYGALLHDIGKMGIPDKILLKKGPLTKPERAIMQQHPRYAYQLLQKIDGLKEALSIPLYHHEKWDGTGYPEGLSGGQIPLAARIFAIIDVWDALTHDRPQRPAWSEEEAIEYIRQQSGKHFDPQVVQAFLALINARNP
ncbi:MAG: PAS domain S-box protein [Anaerolineales bacterium]|nr:PAS domain S-box protein [Anaerolineales bacterium]